MLAAKAAREKAVAQAISGERAPFAGAAAGDVLVSDGALTLAGRNARITYSDLLRFLHRNLSGYLVPTNADIPQLDILFVGDFDNEASPIGVKGMGELTAVSVAPAIANAVYHATGKRIRELPITMEKLL